MEAPPSQQLEVSSSAATVGGSSILLHHLVDYLRLHPGQGLSTALLQDTTLRELRHDGWEPGAWHAGRDSIR
eukprot:791788-Prorocentrum_minimum.AAC.2